LARTLENAAATSVKLPQSESIGLERMAARCWRKIAEWKLVAYQHQQKKESDDSPTDCWWGNENVDSKSILDTALAATSFDKNWYRAWHSWAMANLEFSLEYEKKNNSSPNGTQNKLNSFVTTAIQGFFKAIALSPCNNLQDSLRLLTLWFRNNSHTEVNAAIGDGMSILPVDNWVQVPAQYLFFL
jgi:serine/threonine-protein kinase mTOR